MQRAPTPKTDSTPNPSPIPQPARCDLFAPPDISAAMSTTQDSSKPQDAQPTAINGTTPNPAADLLMSLVADDSAKAPTSTQTGTQNGSPPTAADANGSSVPIPADAINVNGNGQTTNGTDTVNGIPKPTKNWDSVGDDPQASTDPNAVNGVPNTNVAHAIDTSWFKKSCKEVVAALADKVKEGVSMDITGLDLRPEMSQQTTPDKSHVVFSSQDNLWNGTPQILTYYFMEGTLVQRTKVRTAIDEWTWYANVVFQEVSKPESSIIRIKFDPDDGSWSYVGRQCNKIAITDPTMNLAWLDKFSALTLNERAVILHEFGHVLGLLHEHQSPAHGGVAVRNIQAALDLYGKTQNWSAQQVYDQVINVYGLSDVSNFSQVDIHSIMHYPQPKEITGLPEDIPYNQRLTDLDKAYMILQYPRSKMHPQAAKDGWSFERAFMVIGAPADIKNQVLQQFKIDTDAQTGEISPVNSRPIIEAWTRATYLVSPTPGVPTGSGTVPSHDIGGLTPAAGVDPGRLAGDNPGTAPGSVAAVTGPADPPDKGFVKQLYDKLSSLYNPGGSQYFALQFPTRFLDKQTYAYQLNGYFSRMEKPVVVNEAEFALTDALYDCAPIVGGPNGQTLSGNYEKALNSLIPTFENKDVRKQREKMRAWLMKETKAGNTAYTIDTKLSLPGISADTAKELSDANGITITASGDGSPLADQTAAKAIAQQAIDAIKSNGRADARGMTRMEYSDSLMQVYLNDRKTWELKKDDMYREAAEKAGSDPAAMEKLTRTLAHVSAIEEAKIASKYADAVVRGYSHTVRGFMGHLDIKTIGESLQDAKDSFRQSALSSVYTASRVWPVAMQPADWFEALDTSFTREDLSQDPELIAAAVRAKSQLIDTLEQQMANLRGFSKGDPSVAKAAVEKAAADRDTAMANLAQKYTESTISAVKLAIDVAAAVTPLGPAETAASTGLSLIAGAADTDPKLGPQKAGLLKAFGGNPADLGTALTDIGTQMNAVTSANIAVNQASRVLTEHMSDYAEAVAGDTRNLVDALQRQVTSAKAELTDLQESYTIATRKLPESGTNKEVGQLPQGNGGSRWSEVQITSTVNNDYTSTEAMSSSSVSSSQCNFWIGSHSSSSGTSSATDSSTTIGSTLKVDVAMRTTYVTVDRSGWFDPSFFGMSKSFMRGTDDANYSPWCKWAAGQPGPPAKSSADVTTEAIRANNTGSMPTGWFQSFPVGYVLVKDCVIRVTSDYSKTQAFKSHFDEHSESSGGFLCFSSSSASRSSKDSSASSTVATSDGLVVRIPGPQILGYVMQLVGEDDSQKFAPMAAEDLFLEDEDDDKPNGSASTGPSHAYNPNAVAPAPGRAAGIRHYDDVFTTISSVTDASESVVQNVPVIGPAHGIQNPAISAASSSHLVDALQTALADSDVSKWLSSQPEGAKEELWSKLQAAFGKVGN